MARLDISSGVSAFEHKNTESLLGERLGVKGGSHDFKMIVSINETWKTGMNQRANKRDEEYK